MLKVEIPATNQSQWIAASSSAPSRALDLGISFLNIATERVNLALKPHNTPDSRIL
jgi:hypothetical protein